MRGQILADETFGSGNLHLAVIDGECNGAEFRCRTTDSLLHFAAFASDAVGRTLDGETARALLAITAEGIGVNPAALEHAVWRYQRRIPPQRAELPLSLSLSEAS